MRAFITIIILLIPSAAISAGIPDRVCQEVINETILLKTWASLGNSKVKSLYNFKNGELYLSSPIRGEYLYGKVIAIEFNRYRSGYKTIIFSGTDFASATVSHHDNLSVVVSKLHCSQV